jgi:CTP synthase (UTP-ammonia lyase)
MKSIRIALIGDYNEAYRAHIAIPRALDLASTEIGGKLQPTWISTDEIAGKPELQLESFDAVWCVPGSPYRNMDENSLNQAI